MNKEQLGKLLKLSSSEIRDFFILYIGLDCFLKDKKIIKLSKQLFIKEMDNSTKQDFILWDTYSYRLKIYDDETSFYLLFRNKDKKICQFVEPTNLEFKDITSYDDSIASAVIDLLIDACHNDIKVENGIKSIQSLFELRKTNDFGYRFIVGSGVNYGYDMPLWNDLENQFKKVVDGIFKKKICDDISEQTFNNKYGAFQIVKDISYKDYKEILESMINHSKEPDKSDNSTLTSVAGVLYAQSLKYQDINQYILTFNYDDLLERALKNCFSEDAVTIYKNSTATVILPGFSFFVTHSHGFIPKSPDPVLKVHYESVVLTTKEYFDNYKKPSSFGYEELYKHLDKICSFVGNGLTDYEEQKVISKHFSDNPSSFHFFYNSLKGSPIEAIIYKTIFLLKIGIIPLWYNSHEDYKNEFYEYAENLSGIKLR